MTHATALITRFVTIAAIALAAGLAQAQPSASHGVAIEIPAYLGIRIVGAGTGPRGVVFDLQADPEAYLDVIASGQPIAPTSVNRFDDVELNIVAGGRWNVWVYATPLNTPAGLGPHGLTLSDIRIVAGAVSGLFPTAVVGPGNSPFFAGSWVLATAPERIASGIGGTGGWRSLGFNGFDYLLDLDGSETAGTYTTVVTYSLALP